MINRIMLWLLRRYTPEKCSQILLKELTAAREQLEEAKREKELLVEYIAGLEYGMRSMRKISIRVNPAAEEERSYD